MAAVGGQIGTVPVGDRPGTTTLASASGHWSTPVGRAHLIAIGLFVGIVFLHVAAENRFA